MNKESIIKELQFKAVRSGGAGGQHVNKVSTKVELVFNVANSNALSAIEKERIFLKLAKRLTKDRQLLMQCDESRSQYKNKELVIKRFLKTIESALKVGKKRKKTKPSKAAVEKRLRAKKKASEKKAYRSKPDLD
ncbi:aminoacyl-tRNA hydrolase [Flavobacteriaceae bacterium TP-CH-4]|uniref:Aminoacyl-tRNA hydrolase n=1 Tax=Pelagihabitans pacificus TaxID=2696054 RepID=A0A967AS08_9FLAO|nr:alternative ribosome rescue aminoacyl-tRNA hydrolase ArfB [Pelagihabitans pacificus]NHF58927.1 aminoacyl-tRNA hydrolase [Pelagihabitans pacificus]